MHLLKNKIKSSLVSYGIYRYRLVLSSNGSINKFKNSMILSDIGEYQLIFKMEWN